MLAPETTDLFLLLISPEALGINSACIQYSVYIGPMMGRGKQVQVEKSRGQRVANTDKDRTGYSEKY